MTRDGGAYLARVAAYIDALADGCAPPTPNPPDGATADEVALAAAGTRLAEVLAELRRVSTALADGQIDIEVRPRLHLLGPLKALQASLKHLTWQTQEVAAGHLDHQVDFLGEFSTAFNCMVASLREKRRAEQEAMQASRLAAIGQLAAGMAHEINTPIQYIGDNFAYLGDVLDSLFALREAAAEVLAAPTADAASLRALVASSQRDFPRDDVVAALTESSDGARTVAGIVHSMKEFAQPGNAARSLVDINHVITNTLTVSNYVWSPVARVETNLAPDLPPVCGYGAEIGQVMLNLVVNAAQAIADADRASAGLITITTTHDGDDVVIVVADNGPGVPADLRERIFDLFFTTRLVGDGNGQGLAICRDVVVAKHGGRIEVGDNPGGGARFVARLPRRSEPVDDGSADFIDDLRLEIPAPALPH